MGEPVHVPGRVTRDAADLAAPLLGASHNQAHRLELAVRLAANRDPVPAEQRDPPDTRGLRGLQTAMVQGRLDGYRASVVAGELDLAPAHVAEAVVSALDPQPGEDSPPSAGAPGASSPGSHPTCSASAPTAPPPGCAAGSPNRAWTPGWAPSPARTPPLPGPPSTSTPTTSSPTAPAAPSNKPAAGPSPTSSPVAQPSTSRSSSPSPPTPRRQAPPPRPSPHPPAPPRTRCAPTAVARDRPRMLHPPTARCCTPAAVVRAPRWRVVPATTTLFRCTAPDPANHSWSGAAGCATT